VRAEPLPDPGGRAHAPGALGLVQAFVNTVDMENVLELLADPASLRAVLIRIGAGDPGPLDEPGLQRALELREALRGMALRNNGGPVPVGAIATLERAADAAQLKARFDPPSLVPGAGGLDGALGVLVAAVHEALANGTWARMKACRRHPCYWLYYDLSKNRSSTWCSMTVCGNRTKVRAFRSRAGA